MKYVPLLLALCLALPCFSSVPADAAVSTYSEKLPHDGSIEISWESTGLAPADAQAESFVKEAIAGFKERIREFDEELAEDGLDPVPYALSIENAVFRTPGTVTVQWSVHEYLGGAHGSLGLRTRIYDAKTGELVAPEALFALPDAAEEIFSSVSRRELLARGLPQDMVEPGTTAGEGNFLNLIPDARGVMLCFDPYQVAPWSEGVVQVHVSLQELAAAHPKEQFWKP